MSPTRLAALACAMTIGSLAVAVVRPVPVVGSSRPRSPMGRPQVAQPAPPWCPMWFRVAARRADLAAVERWWQGSAMAVALVSVGALALGGPVFGLLAGGGSAAGGLVALRAARHRLDDHIARCVPDSLDSVARSTRAGSSVVQALADLDGACASVSDQLLASVAAQVERGESLRGALEGLVSRHPLPSVRLAVAALLVGNDTGAAPARAVEGVAATLRDRAALDREAVANSSQAQASVGVLVLAPIGFAAFAIATDPRVGDFLFRTWLGWICLALGMVLDGLGAWWMRRIMERAR